jgi:SM-20-related protein
MPALEVFRSLGLFVADEFLSENECHQYSATMRICENSKGTVAREADRELVDETRRQVSIAAVPHAVRSVVQSRLDEIKPKLAEHFAAQLGECEVPQFLVYFPGHLYLPHTDSSCTNEAPAYVRRRKVSAVIFLNQASEQPAPNCYGGGALTFYGLLSDPAFRSCGLPLEVKPGALVAFRSDTVHEVRPVSHGERLTIATWFPSIEK